MSPEGGARAIGPGAVLGDRYRLERVIATGGMATVWLARDIELDRDVAVKILSDVLAENKTYAERFRREARVAAGLSDPSLVRMFDYSGRAERPYLVMEYVAGGTLADRIAAGTATHLDAERLARELLAALATIHEAGVVHRDVKPSNVLLDHEGGTHLTDFGIAQPEDATQLTGTGEVIGTLKYMAPEVLAGQPATERSDLYALGVLLSEALAGRPMPQLEALVDRLTATNPLERPASAMQAASLLDSYEDRATTATVPIGAASAPPSRVIELKARRVLAGLIALAIVGGIVAVALAGGGSDRTPSAGAQHKTSQATTTTPNSTETTTSTTTSTPPPVTSPTTTTPAPAPTPGPKEAKPEKPPKEQKPVKVPPGQAKKD
jgi:eukaryotic-like serine/threonine-protein kinase